jgi:hypothetical protein
MSATINLALLAFLGNIALEVATFQATLSYPMGCSREVEV